MIVVEIMAKIVEILEQNNKSVTHILADHEVASVIHYAYVSPVLSGISYKTPDPTFCAPFLVRGLVKVAVASCMKNRLVCDGKSVALVLTFFGRIDDYQERTIRSKGSL